MIEGSARQPVIYKFRFSEAILKQYVQNCIAGGFAFEKILRTFSIVVSEAIFNVQYNQSKAPFP